MTAFEVGQMVTYRRGIVYRIVSPHPDLAGWWMTEYVRGDWRHDLRQGPLRFAHRTGDLRPVAA